MSQATAPQRVPRVRLPASATAPDGRRALRSPTVHLRVVAPADSRHSSGVAFIVACVTVLALGLATLLILNTQRAQQSFTADSLQADSVRVANTQQDLRSQLQNDGSAASLARRAQQLGLVPATHIRYVGPDGKVVGVAKAATGSAPFILGSLTGDAAAPIATRASMGVSLGATVGAPAKSKAPVTPTSSVTKKSVPKKTDPKTPSTKKSGAKGGATGTKGKTTPSTPATTTR